MKILNDQLKDKWNEKKAVEHNFTFAKFCSNKNKQQKTPGERKTASKNISKEEKRKYFRLRIGG